MHTNLQISDTEKLRQRNRELAALAGIDHLKIVYREALESKCL